MNDAMEKPMSNSENQPDLSRRNVLGCAAIGAVSTALGGCATLDGSPRPRGAVRGRIKQSVAYWCYETVDWTVAQTVYAAKSLGCKSVELVDPKDWELLRSNGLKCAIALNGISGPPFVRGLNNLTYRDEVIGGAKRMIDACAGSDGLCKQVIAFTGYKYRDAEDPTSGEISLEEGAENCVNGLKTLGEYAAPKNVTISIEMLNTRDDTHEMKGHPGYQGDDIDYVAEIVKRVGMPNVKLLFDIYHVQIMNGDLIRRIRQYRDIISHIHVAGNPGRGELHLNQEIDYPAIMQALIEMGYDGYVGQEFLPTIDPMDGLRAAVTLCDV